MGTNKTFSQPTRRRRRIHAPQFKAELVAICQQPGISVTAIALDHGINANLLRRWVTEHERYGKHSLPDDGDEQMQALVIGLPWHRIGNGGIIDLI